MKVTLSHSYRLNTHADFRIFRISLRLPDILSNPIPPLWTPQGMFSIASHIGSVYSNLKTESFEDGGWQDFTLSRPELLGKVPLPNMSSFCRVFDVTVSEKWRAFKVDALLHMFSGRERLSQLSAATHFLFLDRMMEPLGTLRWRLECIYSHSN